MALETEYVQLVHRHGERTPLLYGPHDKTGWNLCHRTSQISYVIPQRTPTAGERFKKLLSYFREKDAAPMRFNIDFHSGKPFNCAPGQLTDVGRANLFGLGTWFWERYAKEKQFISKTFKSEEFSLRSTNFQRTLESLQSLMQGMYRLYDGAIRVEVRDLLEDSLTSNRHCPRLKMLKNETKDTMKKTFANQMKNISAYFSNTFSPHLGSLSPYAIYDLVASSRAHGFAKFKHVPKSVLKDLESYSVNLFFNHLNTKEGLALNTGCVMKEISDKMVRKTENPESREKVSVFSAHDTTIYPMLVAVGVHTKEWPKFGANIVFEMLRDARTEERFVAMLYNGKETPIPKCKGVVKEGKEYCRLEEFVEICEDAYMQNYSEACMEN